MHSHQNKYVSFLFNECAAFSKIIVIPKLLMIYSSEAYAREQTQIIRRIVSEHNGSDFVFAEEPEAKKELWKVVAYSFLMVKILFFHTNPKFAHMMLHQSDIHS